MEVASRPHNLHVQDYLRGHKGQVLCVAARNSKAGDVLVATGAEDSTVRLWDLRNKSNAEALSWTVTSCLCRCFDGEPVASVVFSPDTGDRLYCSAGGKVVEFDLRGGRGELLVTTPNEVYQDDTEEVNELATHHKGEYLAAADDSGVVKVFNTRTKRLHKTLRNVHSNICHAVRFRPRSSWDIASGALDSTLAFWDFSSGRVRSKLNLAEDTVPATSSSHQVFNPPFVHSLDFAPNGLHLAAGIGDGSVVVFDAKTKTPIGRCGGHIAPVSQVHYPCFNPKILISAGNDRRMFFWDHSVFETPAPLPGEKVSGKGIRDSKVGDRAPGARNPKKSSKKARTRGAKPSHSSCTRQDGQDPPPNSESSTNEMPESDKVTADENRRSSALTRAQAGDGDAVPALIEQSVPLVELTLDEKPNWICSISVPYNAVLLADTSPVVKIMRWEGA